MASPPNATTSQRQSTFMKGSHRQAKLASSPPAQVAPQQRPSRRSARLQQIFSAQTLGEDISSIIASQLVDAQSLDALAHLKPSRKRKASTESAPAHCPPPSSKVRVHIADAAETPAAGLRRTHLPLSPSTSASNNEVGSGLGAKRAKPLVSEPPCESRYRTSPAGKRKHSNDHSEANRQPNKRSKADRQDRGATRKKPKESKNTESPAIEEDFRQAQKYANPIDYWAAHQHWPDNFAHYPQMSSSNNTGKRQRRSDASLSDSRSYSQSRKDGEVPKQYTSKYQNHIVDQGLKMDILQGKQLVSDESKTLCKDLQKLEYTAIQPSVFSADALPKVINFYQNRNEAIVQRDITPLLVPSMSSLFFGGDQSVEHLCDEVNAPWFTQCMLSGPTPKPDLAIGLSKSAFDRAEVEKLNRYKSSTNWTQVTENLFFPFLMCEVKCGVEALAFADRQNMHSCSVAVRAILRIVEEADKYRSNKELAGLSGQVLVFSISHDQSDVRLYGHYATCTEDDWSYHRYVIKTCNILVNEDDLVHVHNFIRNILKIHAPNHLKRLQEAISALPEPSGLSFSASALSVNENSQNSIAEAETASDIIYEGGFRKPEVPRNTRQRNDMDEMRQQMERLMKQLREKDEKARQQQERSQQQMDQLIQQLLDKDEKAQQQQEKSQQRIE